MGRSSVQNTTVAVFGCTGYLGRYVVNKLGIFYFHTMYNNTKYHRTTRLQGDRATSVRRVQSMAIAANGRLGKHQLASLLLEPARLY